MKKKSADELESIKRQHEELKIEPGRKAVKLLEIAIDKVLEVLGCDLTKDRRLQQVIHNIHMFDSKDLIENLMGMPEAFTPQLRGFYIFQQLDEKTLVPVAVIGDAYVNKERKICVPINWVRENYVELVVGEKIVTK